MHSAGRRRRGLLAERVPVRLPFRLLQRRDLHESPLAALPVAGSLAPMRMRGPGSKTSLSCSFGVALTLAFSTLSCSVDDRPVTVASSIDPSDAFLFCESYLDARAN